MIGTAARAVGRLGVRIGALLLALGAILQLTVCDRIEGLLTVLFYATPWPLITLGTAALALLSIRRRRPLQAVTLVVLTSAAAGIWLGGSWMSKGERSSSDSLRVVLWNVSRPERRLPAMARWLRAQHADVIALAEAQQKSGANLERWRAEFPAHHVEVLPQNMLCFSRGPLLVEQTGSLAYGSFFAILRTELRGRSFTIIQVDLTALPGSPRRPALDRLAALVRERSGENLIVLGDFNTPRESVHFATLREELTHSFESAGHGLAETWPMPVPLLSLDQIWLSRGLRARRCTHGWSLFSDHRPVAVEIETRPGGTRSGGRNSELEFAARAGSNTAPPPLTADEDSRLE